MQINSLDSRQELEKDSKTEKVYLQFSNLLSSLRKQELADEVVESINLEIAKVNTAEKSKLRNAIRKSQTRILRVVEQKAKIVPVNYYRNLWLALGMAVFGVPFGVILGLSLDNMSYLAIGLPFGMGIGIAIGTGMDKKAKEEGRQLDFVLR
ncbi:hypothetical protein [Halocola ammonii]